MEAVYENLTEQSLVTVEDSQLKLEQQLALPEGMKKIVSATCRLTAQNSTVQDCEVILTGNLFTRLIYINEFEKYDSKDYVEPFEKKIPVKDLTNYHAVFANGQITDSQWSLQDQMINVSNVLAVVIKGVKSQEVRLLSDLTGEVEVKKTEHKILTFNSILHEQFEIEENVALDQGCEGVLGVDANATLKDIVAVDGKVTIKGVIAVNLIGVKTGEQGSAPYSTTHEVEFAKSIVVNGITGEDLAQGWVCVGGITMHIENEHQKNELALKMDLNLHGCTYVYRKFDMVSDAISFQQELTFDSAPLTCTDIVPQVNTMVDIENNLNLPANTPYITRVLAVDGNLIKHQQVAVTDGKATIEGVLCTNILMENEEHSVINYPAEVPFQTHVRMDCLDSNYQIEVCVVPLTINVKARRGVELLIDASFGLMLQAANPRKIDVVTNVVIGNDKVDDGSAIRIYMIGEKETLWDLAKRTNLSCAELLAQNPNLENGCVAGERVIVYRHAAIEL